MRGLGQTWLQRAIGATAWLLLMCAGACVGPGLEPPEDRNNSGGGPVDGGVGPGGTGGAGGMAGNVPPDGPDDLPGDGDGVIDGRGDAGEVEPDASVDDDGGTDPQELEP